MIVDIPLRSHSRDWTSLSGLGASRFESHPELLRQAEAIGNAAGFPTSCRETIEWTPGGNYFNRMCSARCSQSYVHDGFNADLIVADNGFTFVPEIRSICAAAAAQAAAQTPVYTPPPTPPPVTPPVYTPPPASPPVTPPVYTPPPTSPPANQPANPPASSASDTLSETASRIWKTITAGDAGGGTSSSTTGEQTQTVLTSDSIPLWVWLVVAAAAGWFLTRNQR